MSIYIITEGDQAHQDVTELLQRLKSNDSQAGHTVIQTKAALENLDHDTLLMDSKGDIWSAWRYHKVVEEHKAQLVYRLPAVIVATSAQVHESREKLGIEK